MTDLQNIPIKARSFAASPEQLSEVIAYLEGWAESQDISMSVLSSLSLALEEMFVNVAHYAYPDSTGEVRIELGSDGRKALLRLIDEGIPFNPLTRTEPDTSASPEDRPIGGLGIFLVRRMMDETGYEYKEGRNIFTMVKYLPVS